jgi:phosphoenolpyruvate carboxylase
MNWNSYEENVVLKFQILNGLFLGLPFNDIDQAGALLSIFMSDCETAITTITTNIDTNTHNSVTPLTIVETFLNNITVPKERHITLLFKFLQFIERQIVLCDALEDSSFNLIHDLSGLGTITNLLNKVTEHDAAICTLHATSPEEDTRKISKLTHILQSYKTRFVLTAHPTQFYPQSILGIINDLINAIKKIDLEGIRDLFLQMGLTRFSNLIKPTPLDEANSLIWYLEHIFYENLAIIQQKLPLTRPQPSGQLTPSTQPFLNHNTNLEIGLWSGGDRDGNPFVTADTSLKVANLLHQSIISLYQQDLHKLKERLTFDEVCPQLDEIIKYLQSDGETSGGDQGGKWSDNKQLNDRLDEPSGKLKNSQIFIEKLQQIEITLATNYDNLFINLVQNLIIKVQLFGFYFAKLDIRQNSHIHTQALIELFTYNNTHPNYATLNDTDKKNLIKANLNNYQLLDFFQNNDDKNNYNKPNQKHVQNNNQNLAIITETIATIYAIHKIQQQNGKQAIERYIISNTESMVNVFEVFFLINLVNEKLVAEYKKNKDSVDSNGGKEGTEVKMPSAQLIELEIVPLFETMADLQHAPAIMEHLYTDEIYQKHLAQLNLTQTVMLGFSDGTKDGGYLMANWSIYLAKQKLSLLSNKYHVNIIFFDGRGGSPSRGGGNASDFYHCMGLHVQTHAIQLTIQGQTISSNFGTIDSSIYNIEQLFTAGIDNTLFPNNINFTTPKQEEVI